MAKQHPNMDVEKQINAETFDSETTTPLQIRGDSISSHKSLELGNEVERIEKPLARGNLACDNMNSDAIEESAEPPDPIRLPEDPTLVVWDGPSDPGNPMNWSIAKKWYITVSTSLVTLCVSFASSVFSQATSQTAELFHVSGLVMTLATSLVVVGFGFGPLIWGPLSELYGRMIPLWIGFVAFTIFHIPVATAQNVETILIFRFLIGAFGSSTIAIVGGILVDIWDPVARGVAVAIFAAATFVGPIAGPIAGAFIVNSHLGWRWTAWLTFIISAAFGLIGVFTIPETYAPVILQRRAARLRRETKNWALHSQLDEHTPTMSNIATKYLSRPPQMLFMEPILFLMTMYTALIYGMLYLFFFSYPVSFQQVRGWENPGIAALPFLGLCVGILCGLASIVYISKTRYVRKLKEHGRLVPEERLHEVIFGAVCLPIGLFWFSWTSSPDISWVSQTLAGIPIGTGIIIIFLQGINYLLDVYLIYANSALAANGIVRSIFGAVFPLFAVQMYHKLGVNWAGSLLGFLSVAMIPVPILFYVYGPKIRALSRYSPKL
ncbi:hypothetical protein AJ79_02439 [Helicocarpus griseus UAMH5409]|uniref:Major facilitator superfamily (MFS) profile domain-containing protein n=1 Tax=Helicocarpus griseus UAMH5409 TaxID=1447875 RepID=A0A2B7Y3P3_9EURO|nr:hypothetical protein AJ79_02439 [Helicocarpus griseus UAMH5409]